MGHKQVKVWTDPDIAASFKVACAEAGVSMASELSGFMAERTNLINNMKSKNDSRIKSRGGRRREIGKIILMLEEIRDLEAAYLGNIPVNLHNGVAYDAADQSVDILEQAIDLLREAY